MGNKPYMNTQMNLEKHSILNKNTFASELMYYNMNYEVKYIIEELDIFVDGEIIEILDDNNVITTTDEYGTTIWYKYNNGKYVIHRDNDFPAVISENCKLWIQNGVVNRNNDNPAIISTKEQYWIKNNLLHRDGDKPAIVTDCNQIWYQYGNKHREGDLPSVIFETNMGTPYEHKVYEWYYNNTLHRKNDLNNIPQPTIIDSLDTKITIIT